MESNMQAAPTFCGFCGRAGGQGQGPHLYCFGVGDIVMRAEDGHAHPGLVTEAVDDAGHVYVEWQHPRPHAYERFIDLRFVRKG